LRDFGQLSHLTPQTKHQEDKSQKNPTIKYAKVTRGGSLGLKNAALLRISLCAEFMIARNDRQ